MCDIANKVLLGEVCYGRLKEECAKCNKPDHCADRDKVMGELSFKGKSTPCGV